MNDRSDAARARAQRHSLVQALKGAKLSSEDLWLGYFSLGGDAGYLEVDAYAHGLGELPALDRDMLAHVVNERLEQLSWSLRAGYSRVQRDAEERSAPLAALVELIDGTHRAAPDRLPEIVDAAGRALGVRLTVYLVDYEQRFLHPVTGIPGRTPPDTALDVDTTLPGRAFRTVRILPSDAGEKPRLWVPLLDGTERLGVLDVGVDDGDELHDPALRVQCRWVARLLGHLVTGLSAYGDALQRVRHSAPRTPAAELIWSLLPPLTAGVENFVVTGVLEPRNDLNGDAFDYALSDTVAQLLILDAAGHDPRSGLIAASAVAAYRSARQAGHGLFEQSRLIDETLERQFGGSLFATGVLAELDLRTGRLRYVNAGHPAPLIMRDGRIVKPLAAGKRLPFGLGTGDLTVGEEILEPEDWLVLYTDGLIEARDSAGEFFGEARLIDFLRREAAAGHPPPETARRLIRAVLAHQRGALQDDATVVLARWASQQR
ncbi:PP2C family protein-serine/threonine phosphatase [Nocardia asteroides]|uniref:PP2C family protein-serine/threonine phosphatase n=1 Tax=Nocardia asteroides TaxID=1824 RepID=UPI001E6540C3|nr:PP2C family protein-serine/threonine phosphatase [Nocardia asteroides]UGT61598.1 serine/threonine-protein phosphatase [Nocardia asteroides]